MLLVEVLGSINLFPMSQRSNLKGLDINSLSNSSPGLKSLDINSLSNSSPGLKPLEINSLSDSLLRLKPLEINSLSNSSLDLKPLEINSLSNSMTPRGPEYASSTIKEQKVPKVIPHKKNSLWTDVLAAIKDGTFKNSSISNAKIDRQTENQIASPYYTYDS